jgi:hypothetical protein
MFTTRELEYTIPPPHISAVNPSLLLHILTSQLFTGYKPHGTALLQAFMIGNGNNDKTLRHSRCLLKILLLPHLLKTLHPVPLFVLSPHHDHSPAKNI